jgi:integrase
VGLATGRRRIARAPGSLLDAALGVADSQAAPLTRSTYATTYRKFARYLRGRVGREARVEDFTRDALQAYRNEMEQAGRARATIAKDLSALRRLADELELDARIQKVQAGTAKPKQPRPLTRAQLDVLLRAPDQSIRMGKRDRAVLYLMAFAGLRRSEVVCLGLDDIEQIQRNDRPDRRSAIAPRSAEQSAFRIRVQETKRGAPHRRPAPRRRHGARRVAARSPAGGDRPRLRLAAEPSRGVERSGRQPRDGPLRRQGAAAHGPSHAACGCATPSARSSPRTTRAST